MTTVHIAGLPGQLMQSCTRCGYVLTDHRNTMVPEGSGPPGYWETGVSIAVTAGNPRQSWVVTHVPEDAARCPRALDDEGRPILGTCLSCVRPAARGHAPDCRWKNL